MIPTSLTLLATLAWAVAPSAEVYEGIEPQRVFVDHAPEQGRLLAAEAWQRFARTDGAGWTARFDEATGVPRWMWGRGIAVPTQSAEALTDALAGLFDRHAALLGYAPGTLRVRSANHDAGSDTWYVEFAAPREGLDTFRGGLSARVKQGHLVYVKAATAPNAAVTGAFVLTADDAVLEAIAQGPARSADHAEVEVEPLLLERRDLDGFTLRRTFRVTSRTTEPVGRWVSFVDAETGELLEVWNEVRFASGTVTGRHHRRTVDGAALISSPMPFAAVDGSSDSTVADADGDFTLNGTGPYATTLDGDYLRVSNAAGGEGQLSDSSTALEWTTGDASQAEIDTYKFVHDVKAWGDTYAPSVPWVRDPVVATVNLGQTCNAYWDGQLNFFAAGGGCNNTGQIADVVYHEWGHGFHYHSLQGGSFDGAVSEGAGDVTAVLQTQDPDMSPYFFTGGGTIRDMAPNHVYPRDLVGEVHEDGLIFGGAMYDLMTILQQDEGQQAGTASTSEIFAGLLRGGPDTADTFYEALVADDDDGNLENGSAHVCQIYEAFGQHGLGTQTGPSVVLATHDPIVRADAEAPVVVAVDLVSVAGGCEAVRADNGTVHWRADGGAWKTTSMSTSGTRAEASLPALPAGTVLEYWISGAADGEAFEAPVGGDIHPYTAFVGDLLEVHCDDFEQDDGGFTHELLSGTADQGADDWQWGTPNGRAGDPSGAFSGTKVWGNDLGHDDFNGAYQPEKHTRLTSGAVDTRWYTGVLLNYRRWLTVEDAAYDHASILVDEDPVWANHQSAGGEAQHVDGEWSSHVVDLGGKADQRRVRVSFDLQSDGGLEFGGWTIDDVCFVAPATADNRLGIDDFRVEPTSDTTASLSWTQPRHGVVDKVRVVRRTDRAPIGAEDGQIAFEDDRVQVGEPFAFEDTNYHSGTTYYAVYGFDGQDWLSWTVDGWNAAEVELVGGQPPEGVMTEDGMVIDDAADLGYRAMGCGCDQSTPGASLTWALLPLSLVLRRRRD